MDYLPEDVLDNILGRLPGKSLVRFKCVCKTWNSIISTFKFKARAILHTRQKGTFFHAIDDDESIFEELVIPWKNNECFDNVSFPYVPKFCGLINGLFLIEFERSFFLWNPFTGYFNKVVNDEYLGEDIGFCYDPCTNDYKVVGYGHKFIVMSLRTRYWKKLKCSDGIRSASAGPVVQERLHWLVSYDKSSCASSEILHFDPKTDELNELPIRKPKHDHEVALSGLGVLQGKLCMFFVCNKSGCSPVYFRFSHVEVTVMKDYGVAESCTTLFVVSCSNFIPLSFTRGGELLMTKYDDDNKIVAYNPNCGSYRNIDIFLSFQSGWCVLSYVLPPYEPTLEAPYPVKKKKIKKKKKDISWDTEDVGENKVQEIHMVEEKSKEEESSLIEQKAESEDDDKDGDMEALLTLNRMRLSRRPVAKKVWTRDCTMRKGN